MRIQEFTSIGNRAENQDFIAYRLIGDEAGIFVVADGMGGYENGAVAAKVVAEAIVESVSSNWTRLRPERLLRESAEYANESLALKKLALDSKKMGCCICSVLIQEGIAFLTWFGDCRIYIYRNGIECYRTRDHSVAMELADINSLKASDLVKYEHIVTRAIMGSDMLDPMEIKKVKVQEGDSFLLCTDGLHKSISLPLRIPLNLIDMLCAEANSYTDNATCFLIEF